MTGRWLAFFLLGTGVAHAYRTTIERRKLDYTPSLARRFQERDASSGGTSIGDIQNSQYVANLTLGGAPFTVILGKPFSNQCLLINVCINLYSLQTLEGMCISSGASSRYSNMNTFLISAQISGFLAPSPIRRIRGPLRP